jgi:Methyltransferase domain
MYRIEHCPCCDSQNLHRWPATVSPFIATYACSSKPEPCDLCECRSCTFRFFDSRMTGEEISRLYAGYRGDDYYNARHACEPWYTRAANDGIGGDTHEITSRKQNLTDVLGIHAKSITTVLDYGGDRGQMIPDTLGRERFVYEISDAPAVDGVQRITKLDGKKFDFVMLAHVLEHCSEPKDMLNTLKPLLHDESLLYLEVPFERPTMRLAGSGSLQRSYLNMLLSMGPALKLVDFYSTVARVKFNTIPPLGLQKCSEHLNFFTPASLKALLERNGLELIKSDTAACASKGPVQHILYGLARPTAAA